jgi:hypothetical protein
MGKVMITVSQYLGGKTPIVDGIPIVAISVDSSKFSDLSPSGSGVLSGIDFRKLCEMILLKADSLVTDAELAAMDVRTLSKKNITKEFSYLNGTKHLIINAEIRGCIAEIQS